MKVDLFNILFQQIINVVDYGIVLFNSDKIIFANTRAKTILNLDYPETQKPSIFSIMSDKVPELYEKFEVNFLELLTNKISSFKLTNASAQEQIDNIIRIKVSHIRYENEKYYLLEINRPADEITSIIKKTQFENDKLKREIFKNQQIINNSYQLIEGEKKEKKSLQMKLVQLEQQIATLEKQLTLKSMELTLIQSKKD
jgi:hypothetical protein